MEKNLKRRDYRRYEFDKREWAIQICLAVSVVFFFAWFFYRSIWAPMPLSPLGYFLICKIRREKGARLRMELTEQFKECILSVSASLQAGYAVENAFLESREDMRNLYGEDSLIYEELEGIRRGLVINIPLEEMLLDLGERSACNEILQFARMFSVAKRGGGNLPEMIRTSANLISQKIEAKNEVATLLSGRKMEQMLMRIMPFGIVLYVGSTYPGYFEPLYGSLEGVAVMSVCLVLYLLSLWIGEKILQGIWRQMEGETASQKERLVVLERRGVMGTTARAGEAFYGFLEEHLPLRTGKDETRRFLEILYPEEPRDELLKRYYGGKLALSAWIFGLGILLSFCLWVKQRLWASGENVGGSILALFSLASVAIFFFMDKDLKEQVQKRRERLRMGYPDLVHKLVLYLVAGMSIRSAFLQIGKGNEMVRYACWEMQAGQSELTAYEHFGKRAGVREYVKLSTLLCQNIKKGTQTLLTRLEEEAVMCEESRLQSGRRLGEEAGTKLLVPMVMQLAMIMLMIMIPAFSMMGM